MANVLGSEKREQVVALGRLGWSLRRIQLETGVHRETAGAYLKAAGIAVRGPGRWGRPHPNPAKQTFTGFGPVSETAIEGSGEPAWPPVPGRSPQWSACEPYREWIEAGSRQGHTAMSVWQDLVDVHGFPSSYASVKRFVAKLREEAPRDAHPVIETPPGEEGIAKAIRYALNQRTALCQFLEDERLPIHNNGSELALRRQAVGRKAWLFVGSDHGGEVNTTFVTLLASCQLHGIEPWSYLRDLFCLLPRWKKSDVLALSPLHWRKTCEQEHAQKLLAQSLIRSVTLD